MIRDVVLHHLGLLNPQTMHDATLAEPTLSSR